MVLWAWVLVRLKIPAWRKQQMDATCWKTVRDLDIEWFDSKSATDSCKNVFVFPRGAPWMLLRACATEQWWLRWVGQYCVDDFNMVGTR